MKYKTDFKKYWTSEVDKYKSISVEFKRSERADSEGNSRQRGNASDVD